MDKKSFLNRIASGAIGTVKQISTKGSGERASKLLFKGLKSTADKVSRLKAFENSPTIQNAIYKKAGMTGAAKISPMVGLTAVGAAGLAGATAIKRAKNKLDKDIDSQVRSSMAAEDLKVKRYKERNNKVRAAKKQLSDAQAEYNKRTTGIGSLKNVTPPKDNSGYLYKAEQNLKKVLAENPSIKSKK